MRETFKEILSFLTIMVILIGLPLGIQSYERFYISSRYSGAKIINLTAKVKDDKCLWTLEDVDGLTYWWKDFKFAKEIPLREGQRAVFRVKSADVLHSFAIPQFRLGPEEIEAGKVKEIIFEADREGSFKYLCWLWCSNCHGDLTGQVVVDAARE